MAHSSTVVDITMLVDVENVIRMFGSSSKDPARPLMHQNNCCAYMVAPNNTSLSGLGSADLVIRVKVGDRIRWRIQSLSANTSSAAVLYRVGFHTSSSPISTPRPIIQQVSVPQPTLTPNHDAVDPSRLVTTKVSDFALEATIKKSTSSPERYSINYYITVPNSAGEPTINGYYGWDSTIVVS